MDISTANRIREPHTRDCHAFLNTKEFLLYAKDFNVAYTRACYRVKLDPNNRSEWPMEWDKVGRFCQYFWEELPDNAVIRRGPFFKLCDFAEDFTFGDHGI
jgi:hypothetical protein